MMFALVLWLLCVEWSPAATEKDAFIDEAKRIRQDGGVGVKYGNYNMINSPGEKFLRQNGD